MSSVAPRLVLVTPVVAEAESIAPSLDAALAAGDVASVVLRLAAADERSLVNRIKMLAAPVQAREVALIVAFESAGIVVQDVATIAARGGADGVHLDDPGELRRVRERYRDERIVGAGGLATRHDAMAAGEVGADYVMFGEPDAHDRSPPLGETLDRAQWWAEIFETPCIAVAGSVADCAALAATGVEFIGLAPAAWTSDPAGAVSAALRAVQPAAGRAA